MRMSRNSADSDSARSMLLTTNSAVMGSMGPLRSMRAISDLAGTAQKINNTLEVRSMRSRIFTVRHSRNRIIFAILCGLCVFVVNSALPYSPQRHKDHKEFCPIGQLGDD